MEILSSIILKELKKRELNGVLRITPLDVYKKMALLNNIIFKVTDECNLDCYYCVYGSLYKEQLKNEGKKKTMTFDTAINTFNFFRKYWNKAFYERPLNIGFYGGEPLLNLDLIKDIVQYVRSTFPYNKLDLKITTNGILLDRSIDYLVENDFKIMVSLDGNENHNAYRLTRDCKSSFEKIARNLDTICLTYPDYFQKNIVFHSVLHNKNNISEVQDFFRTRYNKAPVMSRLSESEVNDIRIDEFKMISNTGVEVNSARLEIDNEFVRSHQGTQILQIISMLGLRFHSLSELLYPSNIDKLMTGSCLPFEKIFVLADGTLLPCERANCGNAFGNINHERSIDIERIVKRYNSYKMTLMTHNCAKCSSKNFCDECIFRIGNINSNDIPVCRSRTNHQQLKKWIDNISNLISEDTAIINKVTRLLME